MYRFLGIAVACAVLAGLVSTALKRATEAAAPTAGTMAEAATVTMKPGRVALRIQFGLKDKEDTPWDGSITASHGTIVGLDFWRKGRSDRIDGTSWKLSSRPAPRFMGRRGKKPLPPNETGIIVTLDGVDESTSLRVSTQQGDFSFKLAEVPFGKRLFRLRGAVDVVRVPVSYQLTADATEEDYPSVAVAPDGTVYVAYVAFTHGKHFGKRWVFGKEEPEDLAFLAEPTGGDQVLVLCLRNGRWSAPVAVTPGGEDLYKTAIAVDGSGRPWVFWSAQKDGNFDLYASRLCDGRWTEPVRLTDDPGPDINPAATTDSRGRVWVAWQGFRQDNSDILALRQEGESFSEEIVVSADPGNQWDPVIAASAGGDVAIAWDSYERGNYDVLFRVARAGRAFGPVVPVAASLKQEVHASAAYDRAGRLWIAWEEGPERWGKDFGALVKGKGTPLYGGGLRTVAVKCFQDAQPYRTTADLAEALGGRPGAKAEGGRKAGQERRIRARRPLSLPRLTVDPQGRVWLAYRTKWPHFWSTVGTAWFEYVTCYDGDRWLAPIYVHHSDNILDNRPVWAALRDGGLLLVGSSDGRQRVSGYRQATHVEAPQGDKADPVNNDLFVNVFSLDTAKAIEPKLVRVEPEEPVEPVGEREREAIARCRSYRMEIAGKRLQLMRGEFHRHTELSTDGGGDGALIDMYRYALDAVGFDWIGNGDHDNNGGREYPWWITQKTADAYKVGERFVPMFSYERSVSYPDGHRNPIFAKRGIRTLPRFGKPGTGKDSQQPPHTPDTQLLYRYLRQFDGLCASHTSATNMGTDWRDNDPVVEPIVEIYQGCRQNYEEPGAPRAPSQQDAIGGWRPNGFVWRALEKGYRLGFQSSSDHVSTHISYCNVWVEERTREGIFDAMKRRHVYGATDNIIADVRCGDHMMGDQFELAAPPALRIKLIGTAPFKKVDIVRNNVYVYTVEPGTETVEFEWTDMAPPPGTSYYYVRGEQEDGELVWVSPMWITQP